ncbi:MAG: undecaprenyldiphospho-muramoylpentapeptide beta-N-acetylglucosaminyltransferase [Bacteroidota bacterium]
MQPNNLSPSSSPEARGAVSRPLRIIVSGGGTGGHIYPAIAIADELKRLRPEAKFLFVGAEGKMEMEKVPMAGYEIVGLPIRGLERKLSLANLSFPFRVVASLWKSWSVMKSFRPDVVVGTGGYAGGPILYAAAKMGVPTLIQEPNAFAGLANKWLGNQVDKICVAFTGMGKFFPEEKLVITGNPVREEMLRRVVAATKRPKDQKTILLMGGSGGARSLNEAMRDSTEQLRARPQVQWTWQCGKLYYEAFKDCAAAQLPNVSVSAFIDDMETAYTKADIVIGRAGSTTIAEIQFLGKPTILVPSPWVAEDHQTMNAKALTEENAAVLVADKDTKGKLVDTVYGLLDDADQLQSLSRNASAMAQTGAVTRIAEEVLNLISSAAASGGPSPQKTTA